MENTLERIRELLDIRTKADAELKTIQTPNQRGVDCPERRHECAIRTQATQV